MPLEDDMELVRRYESGDSMCARSELQRRRYRDHSIPVIKDTKSGSFGYDEGGLGFGVCYDRRLRTRTIRKASIRGIKYVTHHFWWRAQFRLYGVPFEPGDNLQVVARDALKQGLFDEPSSEIKRIEARLAARFKETKKRHVEQLKAYFTEKAAREEESSGGEASGGEASGGEASEEEICEEETCEEAAREAQ
ncbi:hypothetical protein HD806DRAFT_540502 [Xylariaceae sp. AK1471]|nr:hypothetical protein HD806DRAFT_540502 [Xylariaceae sp. AK1471]